MPHTRQHLVNYFSKIRKSIISDRLHQLILILIGSWIIVFAILSLRQHWGLKTQLDDLGNMAQPLWNTLQGRFMEYSNTGEFEGVYASRLGGHANYIFILLVPLYALWSDPQILLVLQVILVGLGALPLYLLGREYFKKQPWLAVVAPILFLVNPSLHDAILYDLHAIVLSVPLFFTAIYFLLNQNYRWFAVFATGFILCKEDAALILTMLGVWYFVYSRNLKIGSAITVISLMFFIFNLSILMPAFQTSQGNSLISDRYGHLGGSVGGILTTGLSQPQVILADLMAKNLPIYLWQLGIGFGLLPIVSLASIMALPSLAINLLSNNPITSQVYGYYYPAPIIGVFSLSSLLVLKSWKKEWMGIETRYVAVVVIIIGLINSWWYSPLPYSKAAQWSEFQITATSSTLAEVKALIPPEASLTVQNNLGPHFINRRDIVRFPFRVEQSDYVLILLEEPYGVIKDKPRQRNFVHLAQLFPQGYFDEVVKLFEQENLGIVYYGQGYFLFKRQAPQNLNQEAFWDFYVRAQELFSPYAPVYPVEYYQPIWEVEI